MNDSSQGSGGVKRAVVGDRVTNATRSRHVGAVGVIVAVYSRGRVRVRWPDGAVRLRTVGTLRRAR